MKEVQGGKRTLGGEQAKLGGRQASLMGGVRTGGAAKELRDALKIFLDSAPTGKGIGHKGLPYGNARLEFFKYLEAVF
ncbi:MAG: hypothetical protein JW984_07170 [Deltaproteobacteria bacterium]|uniref:Uncharacterized protein n=1 Tax=Candidatus Zymogenus saltonus TaxID=2844893 RepID=A0A9D8PNA6_9DELT|nr:hypothetical protein [Candidatus Zymogenus saltonus]